MDDTIRAFIAIELSKEIKEELAAFQEELKKSGADVRWVKPDGLHLTLKFLGTIFSSKTGEIKEVLQGIAKETTSFQIALSKIGAFPKIDYPRVIWIGAEEEENRISEIKDKLEKRLERIGFHKESRLYQPHLTLGRVKSSKNKTELSKNVETLNRELITTTAKMTVSDIRLFKSTLTPKGAIYDCLCQAAFAS